MYPRAVSIFLLIKPTEKYIVVNSTGIITKGHFLLFTHLRMFQSFFESPQFSLSHEKCSFYMKENQIQRFPEKPDIDQETRGCIRLLKLITDKSQKHCQIIVFV